MKDEAIKEAIEERKEAHAEAFKRQVASIIYDIERKSAELRKLKKELLELQFIEIELNEDLIS